MKLKHNKKRNTAFVYEALIKEATSALLKNNAEKREKIVKSNSLHKQGKYPTRNMRIMPVSDYKKKNPKARRRKNPSPSMWHEI